MGSLNGCGVRLPRGDIAVLGDVGVPGDADTASGGIGFTFAGSSPRLAVRGLRE